MRSRMDRRDMRMRDRARGRMYDRAHSRRSMHESDGEYLGESTHRSDYASRSGSRRDRMYSDGRRRGGRDMKYDDYEDYRDFEYNSDRADEPMELSEEDLKEWGEMLRNSDGTKGPKFNKDQIIPLAKQHGIEFKDDKFTEDEFVMTVNMLYSDYSEALQKSALSNYSRPEPYIHLAEAWLCDEDFEGMPYEKLALYYCEIVEYDA